MQSIKPKLGFGLGNNKDKNRGKVFPQLKMKNGKTLDENSLYHLFYYCLQNSKSKKQKVRYQL